MASEGAADNPYPPPDIRIVDVTASQFTLAFTPGEAFGAKFSRHEIAAEIPNQQGLKFPEFIF
jgi:hypothetical protein